MSTEMKVTLLSKIKPFKTSWIIRVKILHTWKNYSAGAGETLELVLADEEGTKIHASIKKLDVVRYEKYLAKGQWKFIQNFSMSHSTGQYKPTDHAYKIGFVKETFVSNSENLSNNLYLSLPSFHSIHVGEQNQSVLCDILGQVVSVGDLIELEVMNKPTKKLEFELRDATDFRIGCTLWGSFAEKVFQSSQQGGDERTICLIRFAKIREFRGVKSISNAFNATTVEINPKYHEVENFIERLPSDGLCLALLDNNPLSTFSTMNDSWNECEITPILDMISKTEVGRANIQCQITEIDSDWGWYYISCKKKGHKKVFKSVSSGTEVVKIKPEPKWWCELCHQHVTDVVAKYKLHLKVKDESAETKLMLFDTLAVEIVKEKASILLGGNIDEIEDPDDLPPAIQALVGQTFEFGVLFQKENLNGGHDTFKVVKVMSTHGIVQSESREESDIQMNSSEMISSDQPLMLKGSQDTDESETSHIVTPSSKRIISDQSSVTKKARSTIVKLENESKDELLCKKDEQMN